MCAVNFGRDDLGVFHKQLDEKVTVAVLSAVFVA